MARLPNHGLRPMRRLGDSRIESAPLVPVKLVRGTAFAIARRLPMTLSQRRAFSSRRRASTSCCCGPPTKSRSSSRHRSRRRFTSRGRSRTKDRCNPSCTRTSAIAATRSGRIAPPLEQLQIAGFVVNGGRALVMPIWAGGYERYAPKSRLPDEAMDRERRVSLLWQHDLSTTIDCLESQPDMDVKPASDESAAEHAHH